MTVSVLAACEEEVWPTSWRLINASRKQINQLRRTAHLLNGKRYYAATQFATQCFVRGKMAAPLASGLGWQKLVADSAPAGAESGARVSTSSDSRWLRNLPKLVTARGQWP